jgi:site-specific DNA-methyltransferase (adenine-specific)
MNNDLMFSSASNEYATPQGLFNDLNDAFNFTLDPCSTHENHKCDTYFTIEDDGLSKDWSEHVVFMNPPYSKPENACTPKCKKKTCIKRGHHIDTYIPGQEDWIKKACIEWEKGATVVVLIPARTDVISQHEYVFQNAKAILFVKGRLCFGDSKDPAPFPSQIVVFADDISWSQKAALNKYGFLVIL